MREITATQASRHFSKLLDEVEHGGGSYMIVRRGRAIARLEPVGAAGGPALRELLSARPMDAAWARELADLRSVLVVEDRRWPD